MATDKAASRKGKARAIRIARSGRTKAQKRLAKDVGAQRGLMGDGLLNYLKGQFLKAYLRMRRKRVGSSKYMPHQGAQEMARRVRRGW